MVLSFFKYVRLLEKNRMVSQYDLTVKKPGLIPANEIDITYRRNVSMKVSSMPLI